MGRFGHGPGAFVADTTAANVEARQAGQVGRLRQRSGAAGPDIALRDGTLCRHVLKESPCRIGVRKGEQHLLARIERFVDDAGPLALTVNAMLWFKTTFPTGFYQHPIGPT